MRPARSAAWAAILVALWLGTARADSLSIDVTMPAPGGLRAHGDAWKPVGASLRENLVR